jgi:hypothetical protein
MKARLNAFFKESELTQAQFVDRVQERTGFDLKQPRLSEMLNTGKARFGEIEAIAYAFDISPAWLAFEYGDRSKNSRPVIKQLPRGKDVTASAQKRRGG